MDPHKIQANIPLCRKLWRRIRFAAMAAGVPTKVWAASVFEQALNDAPKPVERVTALGRPSRDKVRGKVVA